MAITTFTVNNLNSDFEFPDGFWFTNQSDGGIDPDTNDDGTADDPSTIAPTATQGSDRRGTWVWCNGTSFKIDGDVADPRSNAGMLSLGLEQESFTWLPDNPAYNTVAPFLKDGTTVNPDFDNSNNPLLMVDIGGPGDSAKAARVGDVCKHFNVTTTVTTAKKPRAKAKSKDK